MKRTVAKVMTELTYFAEHIEQRWRISFAIIRNFSKLISPSTLVSFPSFRKVKSFMATGNKGSCWRKIKKTSNQLSELCI